MEPLPARASCREALSKRSRRLPSLGMVGSLMRTGQRGDRAVIPKAAASRSRQASRRQDERPARERVTLTMTRHPLLLAEALSLLLVGCTLTSKAPNQVPSAPGTPVHARPDLALLSISLEMADRHGGSCVEAISPYGIRIGVGNEGSTASGPFEVELDGIVQVVAIGLNPGETVELHFPGTVASGRYVARLDPSDRIAEEDEANNDTAFIAPTPSPPPICTPGPG